MVSGGWERIHRIERMKEKAGTNKAIGIIKMQKKKKQRREVEERKRKESEELRELHTIPTRKKKVGSGEKGVRGSAYPNLTKTRIERGLLFTDISKILGVSSPQCMTIERGKCIVLDKHREKLEQAFNVSSDWLFDEDAAPLDDPDEWDMMAKKNEQDRRYGKGRFKNVELLREREKRRLTQEAAAREIGVSAATLTRAELGKKRIQKAMKEKIADYYGKEIDELFKFPVEE